ncbi:MAG: U32 family peptidase [Lachnospiraceae bacterium]|jgi:putative protease|nr:U32 family peptidase [Lachnospiraceae bacterium]MCI1329275.1 U32 family peptidase [Lachnospiraceae bacterium]
MRRPDRKPELLSPAGSIESLHAAVKAGADAVYIGGRNFGARAYADNPDEQELLEAIDYIHFHGKKLYLTVNTLEKEEELERELGDFLEPYVRRGLDGVIVQDFGAVDYISRVFPSLPIHASTQMAVTGAAGACLLAERGITRVVPARELTLPEIREIREKAGVEVECFIHGAMCYSYSGMCLMSSMIGGRSGNRGRCAGICRLPFQVGGAGGRRMYPLNMKDLCALPILPDLIRAGISSFKIEGRMKKPEYTAGVTKIYRKNIDRYFEDPDGYWTDPADLAYLELLFSRDGFTEGYYHSRGSADMIDLENRRNSDPAVRNSKKVQELYDGIRKELGEDERRRPVDGILEIGAGAQTKLTLKSGAFCTSSDGAPAQKALSRPMSDERILEQIRKFGGSPFRPEHFEVRRSGDEPLFIPVGELNRLRREAADRLSEAVTAPYRREDIRREAADEGRTERGTNHPAKSPAPLFVQVSDREQLRAVLNHKDSVCGIIVPIGLAKQLLTEETPAQLPVGTDGGRKLRIALPQIVRSCDCRRLDRELKQIESQAEIEGILAGSLDGIGFLKSTGREKCAIADGAVYTMNNRAVRYLRGFGVMRDTIPHELNFREMLGRENSASELVLYGRTPLMVSAGCVRRTVSGCDRAGGWLSLTDRRGASFPVQCCCDFCCNVIYNSLPTSLLQDFEDVRRVGAASFRIVFTIETGKEADQVLSAFEAARAGGGAGLPFPVTHGHFRRGVQ